MVVSPFIWQAAEKDPFFDFAQDERKKRSWILMI
jgi:hypothetical protein